MNKEIMDEIQRQVKHMFPVWPWLVLAAFLFIETLVVTTCLLLHAPSDVMLFGMAFGLSFPGIVWFETGRDEARK